MKWEMQTKEVKKELIDQNFKILEQSLPLSVYQLLKKGRKKNAHHFPPKQINIHHKSVAAYDNEYM